MKVLVMGTAAYERVPAMFCKCPACMHALKFGGKNVRTQAQVLIDDVLLVDFGQDNYLHFLKHQKDYTKLQALLVTHSHQDHFMPDELEMTRVPFTDRDLSEPLQVFGNAECKNKFSGLTRKTVCNYTVLKPYDTVQVKGYTVTALPASHGTTGPLCYIIQKDGRTLLYNNDSALFDPEVYGFIKEKKFRFDAVLADCTYAMQDIRFGGSHMSLHDNGVHRDRLEAIGAVCPDTRWIITHFSHNGLVLDGKGLSAEDMEKIAADRGMYSAHDGMEFEV